MNNEIKIFNGCLDCSHFDKESIHYKKELHCGLFPATRKLVPHEVVFIRPNWCPKNYEDKE